MEFFRRKKKNETEKPVNNNIPDMSENITDKDIDTAQENLEDTVVKYDTPEKRRRYIENYCEQMIEAEKRLTDVKQEYQMVNAYLSDVQIISDLPEEEKTKVVNLAKRIVVFENDREEYSRAKDKLTYMQYSFLDDNKDEIKDMIKSLDEDEAYCRTVRTDMKYLEGEKMGLKMERHELSLRLETLGNISKMGILSILTLTFIIVMYGMTTGNNTDMMIYAIVAASAVLVALVFGLHRKTLYDIRYTELKINRAITMLNKVKIKYVNVASRLEYEYEKYGVKSSVQLGKMWNQYLQENKRREVYKRTSEKLISAEEDLVSELEKYNIKDPDIWIQQAYMIISPAELDGLLHKLEKRRQKVRVTMDYNLDVIDKSKFAIQEFIDKNRKYAREIMKVIDEYNA